MSLNHSLKIHFLAMAWIAVASPSNAAVAEQPGSIEGKVLAADGSPAADARVSLSQLRRQVVVRPDGSFAIERVPPGTYLLEANSARYGKTVEPVTVQAAAPTQVSLKVDIAFHEEVVVSTYAEAALVTDSARPVDILAGKELTQQLKPTIGETLAEQPGMSSTYFGPGASRPVIRGLGGDRVRIMENGTGVGDASNVSPDHAVSNDPVSAERIEVVRGPASLLYGSSAIGGVVNVVDRRIPGSLPDRRFDGSVLLESNSVSQELGGSFTAEGRVGGPVVLHAEGHKRNTENLKIPGFAVVDSEEGEKGTLLNSQSDTSGFSAGLSAVGEQGFLGASYTVFDTTYGIPTDEMVHIDMNQRRFDAQGELDLKSGLLHTLKLRFGNTDYDHAEIEQTGEIGTQFFNKSWEGRVDLLHRPLGPFDGSLGVQFGHRDFEAVGEEAFVPRTKTPSVGVFVFEEVGSSSLKLQLGARYDNQDVKADTGIERSLDGFSGSVGLVWLPSGDYSVGISFVRGVKLPNPEELFANGPHAATETFEIGDADLNTEKSLGLDVSLRRQTGRITGEVNFFLNSFDDYIYDELTEEIEDDLPVVRFVNRNTQFVGGELQLDAELVHSEPHHLTLELSGDYVRAELRDTNDPLQRIPPLRYGAGLRYEGSAWSGRVHVRRVETQDRVGLGETETPGYTMLGASVGYRFFVGNTVQDVMLHGDNLTDEEARDHVSFLKDFAPLPGRNVGLSYKLVF